MAFTNVEIKARCGDIDTIRKILLSGDADFRGVDHQIDTYFNVPVGRMKLREGDLENALIHYVRGDQDGPKRSDIILYTSSPHSTLKELLAKALGIKVVVDKQREIYFIENVKFHLDTVNDLGTFVEIEAIDTDGTIGIDRLRQQCEDYLKAFAILSSDLVSVSYSDLLLRAENS